ncbi:hypothetical protein QUC31_001336 [Theobroma cacao]
MEEGQSVSGEEEEPLSPMARMFHEPDSNVYIILIVGFKSPIEPDSFKANLVHTLLKHPCFSGVQVADENNGGELKWVKTEVELEKHVIIPRVDEEMASQGAADKFVEDYIANISKTKINLSIPMWDCHILNLKTSYAESDTPTPLKPSSRRVACTPGRIVRRTFTLDDIKLVKNGTNMTVNDVVLGITQAGLSRYLNRKYGKTKRNEAGREWEDNLPNNIRLRATLFINLRSSPGIYLAKFPLTNMWFSNMAGPQDEITIFGNQVAYIAPSLYGQPVALTVHVVSYAKMISMVLSIDDNIIPDPYQLCDDLEESLKLIKKSAISQ